MPPRSQAVASAAGSIASTSLRRSSRRSIATSTSSSQEAVAIPAIPTIREPSVPSASRQKRPRIKAEPVSDTLPLPTNPKSSSQGARGKQGVKTEVKVGPVKLEEREATLSDNKPAVKKRRTKKEVEEENEIFPPRPSPQLLVDAKRRADRRGSGLFIGAHISSAGGVENAPLNALRIGGNAFSCFVRPKMQWASNPIPDASIEAFRHRVAQHGFRTSTSNKAEEDASSREDYGYVVPHGCYLVNLANPDESKRDKSFEAFIDDLQRCEQLGVRLFNFHPGSMTAASATEDLPAELAPRTDVRAAKADACALVASYINRAHSLTSSVVILIENMAGSKNDTILGSSLYDLASIMSRVTDKSRVGVCIDTCHAFAAGYDLTSPTTYESFASLIDSTIGWESVRAFHLNDSKFPLSCRRDRHENIGRGHIGIGGFWSIVNDERWNGIPLILETPALGNASAAYPAKEGTKRMHEVWSYQIQALYALRGTKWGEWKEAEEWLVKADQVVEEAVRLHAAKKKAGGEKKSIAKKNKKKNEEEDANSDLSSDE